MPTTYVTKEVSLKHWLVGVGGLLGVLLISIGGCDIHAAVQRPQNAAEIQARTQARQAEVAEWIQEVQACNAIGNVSLRADCLSNLPQSP